MADEMLAKPGDDNAGMHLNQGYPHPIAYTYEADTHCPVCTARAFGVDAGGWIPEDARDSEGNGIGVIAPWDTSDWLVGIYCSDCDGEVLAPSADDEREV